jgi:hypothetical protein
MWWINLEEYMNRLTEKQHTFVIIMMQVLEKAWKDSPYNTNIDRQYGIVIPPIMENLKLWTDWSHALSEIIPILEAPASALPNETPAEREQDLQIIYDRLNLTPPTD